MDNKDLELLVRDILDRNNFINQKIDLSALKAQNNNIQIQDVFRIRVMPPSINFAVEIVKPIPLKDFMIIAGRMNISEEHLSILNKLDLQKRMDFFDEVRFELTKRDPNFKFVEGPDHSVVGIECMTTIFITTNEEEMTKQLFQGIEKVNKSFFLFIVILQRFLRNAGYSNVEKSQSDMKSFYQ